MKRIKKRATIISTGIRFPRTPSKSAVLRNNQKLIMLTLIFICGLFVGALTVKNTNAVLGASLKSLLENYYTARSGQSVLHSFLSVFGSECIFLLIAMLFGVCIIGEPILWLLPFVKGLGIGIISGYLYQAYTLQGMTYFSVYVLPSAVLASAALLLGCKESILMTRDLTRILLKGESNSGIDMFKLYILRYAVLLGSLVFCAALSTAATVLFADKINLF
ncbi:MAG: stage II sporulation protein M [Lachnospiraceae bacterium]